MSVVLILFFVSALFALMAVYAIVLNEQAISAMLVAISAFALIPQPIIAGAGMFWPTMFLMVGLALTALAIRLGGRGVASNNYAKNRSRSQRYVRGANRASRNRMVAMANKPLPDEVNLDDVIARWR